MMTTFSFPLTLPCPSHRTVVSRPARPFLLVALSLQMTPTKTPSSFRIADPTLRPRSPRRGKTKAPLSRRDLLWKRETQAPTVVEGIVLLSWQLQSRGNRERKTRKSPLKILTRFCRMSGMCVVYSFGFVCSIWCVLFSLCGTVERWGEAWGAQLWPENFDDTSERMEGIYTFRKAGTYLTRLALWLNWHVGCFSSGRFVDWAHLPYCSIQVTDGLRRLNKIIMTLSVVIFSLNTLSPYWLHADVSRSCSSRRGGYHVDLCTSTLLISWYVLFRKFLEVY